MDATQIKEARGWVSDCSWADEDFDVDSLSDDEVLAGIGRHYDGGIAQFKADMA